MGSGTSGVNQNNFFSQVTQRLSQIEREARGRIYSEPAMYETAVMTGNFTIGGALNVFLDTGLSITLPSIGTYRVSANIRGVITGNAGAVWWEKIKIYDSTAAADIADSERIILVVGVTRAQFQVTCPLDVFVTVTQASVLNVYVARDGAGGATFTQSQILSDANGRSTISYQKMF